MSDLTATNCGCNNGGCDNNSCLWIILLLIFCGGCGNGMGRRGDNCGCDNSCIWIILLLIFCGGCGNGLFGRCDNDCDCDSRRDMCC